MTNDNPETAFPPSARFPSWQQQTMLSTLGERQATEMFDQMTRDGVAPERIQAAAAASGIAYQPDQRTPAEKAFDAVFPQPPKHDAYRIAYSGRTPEGMTPEQVTALDATARDWLGRLMFDDHLGPQLVEDVLDTATKVRGMSEADLGQWQAEQRAMVEKIAGSAAGADEFYRIVNTMLDAAPGEFSKLAKRSMSASFIVNAALHGQRVAIRGGLRKG